MNKKRVKDFYVPHYIAERDAVAGFGDSRYGDGGVQGWGVGNKGNSAERREEFCVL